MEAADPAATGNAYLRSSLTCSGWQDGRSPLHPHRQSGQPGLHIKNTQALSVSRSASPQARMRRLFRMTQFHALPQRSARASPQRLPCPSSHRVSTQPTQTAAAVHDKCSNHCSARNTTVRAHAAPTARRVLQAPFTTATPRRLRRCLEAVSPSLLPIPSRRSCCKWV